MKNILEIYEEYKIPKHLQIHQIRVASVAKEILDNFTKEIDNSSVLKACLLHDMGNIVKFNLKLFPELFVEEGMEYWEEIKSNYIKKYGNDEHEATYKIAKELDTSEDVIFLIENIGFGNSEFISNSDNLELKIASYSDNRVTPFGITSARKRFEEGKNRFIKNKPGAFDTERSRKLFSFVEIIEYQIFENTSITPEHIDNYAYTKHKKQLSKVLI